VGQSSKGNSPALHPHTYYRHRTALPSHVLYTLCDERDCPRAWDDVLVEVGTRGDGDGGSRARCHWRPCARRTCRFCKLANLVELVCSPTVPTMRHFSSIFRASACQVLAARCMVAWLSLSSSHVRVAGSYADKRLTRHLQDV
jgi:hypothetical protein